MRVGVSRGGFAALSAVALTALALSSCTGSDDSAGSGTELTWFIANQPGGSVQEVAARCSEESDGRYNIKVELLAATDANQAREQLVRRLGAEDDTHRHHRHGRDLDRRVRQRGMDSRMDRRRRRRGHRRTSSTAWSRAHRSKTSSTAAPHSSNTQVLWYRTDLVDQPPQTWDDMLAESERLGDEGIVQVQANRYEGFTVFFNMLLESAGTQMVDESGEEVVLDKEPTERALEVMGRVRELADGARARRRHVGRGLRRARIRSRELRVHAQLHIRLRERERERSGHREEHGRGSAARGRRGPTRCAAARAASTSGSARSRRTPTWRSRRPSAS